jgi:hypothetical protein
MKFVLVLLRRNIAYSANRMKRFHNGTGEFERKDTVHIKGVAGLLL